MPPLFAEPVGTILGEFPATCRLYPVTDLSAEIKAALLTTRPSRPC